MILTTTQELLEFANEKGADLLVRYINKMVRLPCPFCQVNHRDSADPMMDDNVIQYLMLEEPGEDQQPASTLFCPHCHASFDIGARCQNRHISYVKRMAEKMGMQAGSAKETT